jgi:hypothetical protein
MYFNAYRARIPGLGTTDHGRISTYPVSHNGGRVKNVCGPLTSCLIFGVQSNRTQQTLETRYLLVHVPNPFLLFLFSLHISLET